MIDFLTNCGNKNLQYLLVPSRLEAALAQLDSDRDGEIDCNEWCVSESGAWGGRGFDAAMASTRLTGRRSAQGGRDRDGAAEQARAARQGARGPGQGRREGDRQVHERVPERTAPGVRSLRVCNRRSRAQAARQCFIMIDKDNSGTLEKPEIVRAVKEDKKVIDFLKNCGEENLQFLLHPPRLDKALDALDTDKSGELDIEECTARRLFVSARFALLTARLLRRGSRHQPRPREAPGAAGRRARAPPARRGAGRRRIHARIFERGARGLPNDRQGRLGNAR